MVYYDIVYLDLKKELDKVPDSKFIFKPNNVESMKILTNRKK